MKLSPHTDQRGIGHIAIIVAVLVIAAVGLVGWRVSQKSSDKASSTTVSDKAAIDACNKVYHDKDLCKFTGNYDISKLSYKMDLKTTGNDGNSTGTFLSDGKGNSSIVTTGSGGTAEFIVLDKVSYMKDSTDGKWFKFAPNESTAPKETNPTSDVKFDTATDTAAKSTLTYKKLGKEACGKLTCFKYQMIDSSQPNVIDYFWFDTKDYRLQHYYNKDANGSTSDMVITYQAVSITAPSPTKEFNAGVDTQALQQSLSQSGTNDTSTDTSTDSGQ
jgi:hypothetical protein